MRADRRRAGRVAIPYAAPPVDELRCKAPQLQLMWAEYRTGNRVEDVSAFSRRLNQLMRELDGPVIAVSQLDGSAPQRLGVVTTRMGGGLRCLAIATIVLVDVSRISTCGITGEESIFFCPGPREM